MFKAFATLDDLFTPCCHELVEATVALRKVMFNIGNISEQFLIVKIFFKN